MGREPSDPLIGKEIINNYQITEVLGRGGMGVVYKARHTELEEDRALKMIGPSQMQAGALRRRIKKEAKRLVQLESPYVVRVFDLRETDYGWCIVMEYLEGETLSDVIEREGHLDWKEAVEKVQQVLRALEAAHDEGVIHRDIKPGNIMVTESGRVKLFDFGLAKATTEDGDRTVTQGVAGTPRYMSPEQVRGFVPVDHRSDLYSVGMTLLEMITGDLPFEEDDSHYTIMDKIVAEDFSPLDVLGDEVPSALREVLERALRKDPDRRFQSVHEMKDALEAIDLSTDRVKQSSMHGFNRYLRVSYLIAPVLVAALTYYNLGAVNLEAVQSWFEGKLGDAAEQPPAGLVTETLDDYLPEGFVSVGQPILISQSQRAEGSEYVYRIKLRAVEELYRVPVVDLKLPPSLPNQIREWSHLLRISSELAPGKTYDINDAQQEIGSSEQIEAQWRVHLESRNGRWTLIEADTVKLDDLPSLSAGPNEEIAFLTRQELDNFRRQRDEMLGIYQTRWEAFKEDIDSFRTQTFRKVPSPCSQKVTRLKMEVERLGGRCPQISNAAERSECIDRRDSLKSELDACRSQNDLHLKRHEKAKRLVKEYRRERLRAMRENLVEKRN